MEEFGLVILGAVVGAFATGGVAFWDAGRERRQRRRVAARLILGDLYVLEAGVEIILTNGRWPDRSFDLQAVLETWRENRGAFAGGVKAWEWALVDGLFSNIHRTAPMVDAGQPTTLNDRSVLESLQQMIPRARDIVLQHAASQKELDDLVEQLKRRAG